MIGIKKISLLVAEIFKQVTKKHKKIKTCLDDRQFYARSQEKINADITRELLFRDREYYSINRRNKQ